jgi:hypothetical protein
MLDAAGGVANEGGGRGKKRWISFSLIAGGEAASLRGCVKIYKK